MLRFAWGFLSGLALFAIGWGGGSIFGVPQGVRQAAQSIFGVDVLSPEALEAAEARSRDALQGLEQASDQFFASFGEDLDAVYGDETGSAVEAETAIATPEVNDAPEDGGENAAIEAVPAPPAAPPAFQTDDALMVCATSVSNAPRVDENRMVAGFQPIVSIDGVELLIAPATRSCLSSGFGPRGSSGRLHRGVDYYTKEAGDVLAAGDGVILEAVYRDDYGYMVVIDHGGGIYTRSAHLKRFNEGVVAGASVTRGQVLGPIGSSGAYTSAVHLHLEFLRGDITNPRGSFGLEPINPFAL